MLVHMTREEADRLDRAVESIGVGADDIAAAAVVSFLAGRDTPSKDRRSHRRSCFSRRGRITPRPTSEGAR